VYKVKAHSTGNKLVLQCEAEAEVAEVKVEGLLASE
jgi:hypothetical protein